MTWEAAVKRTGIALLILMPSVGAEAGAAPSLQIAQAGANETTPGGVEHQPTMEPDAAAPMAIPPPPPAMPEVVAPPAPPVAAEPVSPPAAAVPSETNAGSQKKMDETKPEKPSNKKSKKLHAKVPLTTAPKDGDSSGGDERQPGGVEHAPSTDH